MYGVKGKKFLTISLPVLFLLKKGTLLKKQPRKMHIVNYVCYVTIIGYICHPKKVGQSSARTGPSRRRRLARQHPCSSKQQRIEFSEIVTDIENLCS